MFLNSDKLFRLLLGSLLCLVTSCADEASKNEINAFDFDENRYADVISLIDGALRDYERQVAFYGYTERDQLRLKSSLETARGGLLTLANGSDPQSAYIRLSTSLKTFDDAIILDRDLFRLEQIFNEVEVFFDQLSRQLGYENNRVWNLYNYNFSQGVEPEFRTFGTHALWGYNFLINIPKAAVGGRNGANAWLVSRVFDLQNVKYPSFRFDTLLMVDSRDQTLDRIKAIREVFKVYLVFDTNPLEDLSQYNDTQLEEMEEAGDLVRIHYDPSNMPLGENFHRRWVPSRNLEEYKSRPFSVAFRFDPPSQGLPQYHMWQIFDFEINGSGVTPENPIKYSRQFTSDDGDFPSGFHGIKLNPQGDSWELQERDGKVSMAISAQGSEALLLTPKYYIQPEMRELSFHLSMSFNRESFDTDSFSKMKILVSKDYKGGDPRLFDWHEISYRDQIPQAIHSAWMDTKIVSPLSRYAGEELTFAFLFESSPEERHQWKINGFYLTGRGGDVSHLYYNLGCFEENPYEQQTIYRFDLDSYSNSDTTTRNLAGNPPTWRVVSRDTGSCFPKQFFEISGHKPGGSHDWGETRKILPAVDLGEISAASFRFLYSLNYWSDPSTTEIQISEVGHSDWQTLNLPKEALGTRRNNYWTQWIPIPTEYIGKEVQFALKYHSFQGPNEQKPNFEFKRLEVKVDAENDL